MSLKHRCCPLIGQTWIAIAIVLTVVLAMSFMQLYSDSLPEYPPECISMYDFAFRFLPRLEITWLADTWVLVSIIIFFLLCLFDVLNDAQLVIRRFALILAVVFLFRAIIIADTRYPSLRFDTSRYQPRNWFVGAFAIIAGVRHTATDMMFSGHTTNWLLTSLFVIKYSGFSVWSILYWLFNMTGIVILLAEGEHYLSDVIVALVVSGLSFLVYHLMFDGNWTKVSWDFRWYKSLRWLDAE